MTLLRLDQAEHARARQHRLTASRAKDLMSGNYKTWNRLAWDMRGEQHLLGQRSGIPQLDWGIDKEPLVRAWVWERHPDWEIKPGGLLTYHDPDHALFSKYCACSPDGIIQIRPAGWGLEVKAPYNLEIHLRYVREKVLPEAYVPQVQYSLWVSGFDRWVFASGYPGLDDAEEYFDLAVEPDPKYHDKITELAARFLEGYEAEEPFRPLASTAANFDRMF